MSNVPVQVIVAAFRDENAADKVIDDLVKAKKEGLIDIEQAVVLRRDKNNELHMKDVAHMGAGKGAAIGGIIGGIVGLLAGPVGWLAGSGALIGAFTAKASQSGFPIERVKELGEGLRPGTSAVVAIVDHKWVVEAERIIQQERADYMVHALAQDIATQLDEGKDVIYTAVGTDAGVAAARMAGNENEVEYSDMVDTEHPAYEHLTYIEGFHATESGIDTEAVFITDQGVEAVFASAPAAAAATALPDSGTPAAVPAAASIAEPAAQTAQSMAQPVEANIGSSTAPAQPVAQSANVRTAPSTGPLPSLPESGTSASTGPLPPLPESETSASAQTPSGTMGGTGVSTGADGSTRP